MSQIITDINFDFNTIQTLGINNSGDLWPVTWDSNDYLFFGWGDGVGFTDTYDVGDKVSIGFGTVDGIPTGALTTANIWGGDNYINPTEAPFIGSSGKGKPNSIISIDGILYAIVSMEDGDDKVKIASSINDGANWVVSSVVFDRSADSFVPNCFFQFGKDNIDAPDSYVYMFGRDYNGSVTDLYLCRVAKTDILIQANYEVYTGMSGDIPQWSTTHSNKVSAINDANEIGAPAVTYNKIINRYILTAHNTDYVGKWTLYEGETPWGPWYTVKSYTNWNSYGGYSSGMYHSFPAKWISTNGKTMWMTYSGEAGDNLDLLNLVRCTIDVLGNKWENIGPGAGGWHRCVRWANNTTKAYLSGDRSGIDVSTDGGATWTQSSKGLYNYAVEDIAVDPNNGDNVILASRGGVYRTVDGGANWNYVWTDISGALDRADRNNEINYISAVEWNRANSNYCYAGQGGHHPFYSSVANIKIYRSTNGGLNWNDSSPGLIQGESGAILCIASDPNDASVVYASSRKDIYKSTDYGASWSVINSGWGAWYIAVDPNNSNNVFVLKFITDNTTGSCNVYKSTDGGTSFTLSSNGITNSATWNDQDPIAEEIHFDPVNTSNIYIGIRNTSAEQVWKSTDGGANWSDIGTTYNAQPGWDWHETADISVVTSLAVRDGKLIKTPNPAYSTNDGTTWLNGYCIQVNGAWKSTGTDVLVTEQVLQDPTTPSIIYQVIADNVLMRSEDSGDTWVKIPSAKYKDGSTSYISGRGMCINPSNRDDLYLIGDNNYSKGIVLRSTDRGASFNPIMNGLNDGRKHHIVMDQSNFLYVYQQWDGLYRSVNNGASWVKVIGSKEDGVQISGKVSLDPQQMSVLYCAIAWKGVFKSTDSGTTWTKVAEGNYADVAVDPTNTEILWAIRNYGQTNFGVYKSTNGGNSFSKIWAPTVGPDGLGSPWEANWISIIIDPDNHNNIYIGGKDSGTTNQVWNGLGVYRTTDGGVTWEALSDGLGLKNVKDIFLSSNKTLYIGTDARGVFRLGVGSTGGSTPVVDDGYYVSNSGTASWADSSPTDPCSLSTFNSNYTNLSPGDSVFFARGETFDATLLNALSNINGAVSQKITISSFGTGNFPIFTTLEDIPGADNAGNWALRTGVTDAFGNARPDIWRNESLVLSYGSMKRIWVDDVEYSRAWEYPLIGVGGHTVKSGTVSTMTSSGTTVTVTAAAHGLSSGEEVRIKGANESNYNGFYNITIVDSDTFTYTAGGTPSSTPATGTITYITVFRENFENVVTEGEWNNEVDSTFRWKSNYTNWWDVYSPGGNPATEFSTMKWCGTQSSGVSLSNCSHFIIENIEFRGGFWQSLFIDSCTDFEIRNVVAGKHSGHSAFVIRNCERFSLHDSNTDSEYGLLDSPIRWDTNTYSIDIQYACKDVEIYNNILTGFHNASGVRIIGGVQEQPENISIHHNHIHGTGLRYARYFIVTTIDTGSEYHAKNINFYNNYIEKCSTRAQIYGESVYTYMNLILHNKEQSVDQHILHHESTNENYGIWEYTDNISQVWEATMYYGSAKTGAVNAFFNNTIIESGAISITPTERGCIVLNNIILNPETRSNTTPETWRRWFEMSIADRDENIQNNLAIYELTNLTYNNEGISYNGYNVAYPDYLLTDNEFNTADSTYTSATINSNIHQVTSKEAVLSDNYKLLVDGAALDYGVNISSYINSDFLDMNGNSVSNTQPLLGAIQGDLTQFKGGEGANLDGGTGETGGGTSSIAAPSNLQAHAEGSTITLTWEDNATNETGFEIRNGDAYMGSVGIDKTRWVKYGATVGTYYFRVRAFSSTGTSDYSNTVQVSITANPLSIGQYNIVRPNIVTTAKNTTTEIPDDSLSPELIKKLKKRV